MKQMHKHGITIEVPDESVDFYKRAGYEVVKPVKPEPKHEAKAKASK